MIGSFFGGLVNAVVSGWKDGWTEPMDALDSSVPSRSTTSSNWWSDAVTPSPTPQNLSKDPFSTTYLQWCSHTSNGATGGSGGTSIGGWWNSIDSSTEFKVDDDELKEVWFWDTTEIYDFDGDLVALGLLNAAFASLEEATFFWFDLPDELKRRIEGE